LFKRGEASLKLPFGSYHAGEGEEILERGFAPLLPTLPPSLNKGRGSGGFPEKSMIFLGAEGDRLLNNLFNGGLDSLRIIRV